MNKKNIYITILILSLALPNYVEAFHFARGSFKHNGTYATPYRSITPWGSQNTGTYHHNHRHNRFIPRNSPNTLPSQYNHNHRPKINNNGWNIYY